MKEGVRMERMLTNDEKAVWESRVSEKAFFLRSFPSIIFRVWYLLFSIFWMYRWFYLKAAYLFLVLGLFFLITSIYLLFYPKVVAKGTKYSMTKSRLTVPGSIGKAVLIPLSSIKGVADISSGLDKKEGCKSFEIEYVLAEGESNYYEMRAVKDYNGFEAAMKSVRGAGKQEREPQPDEESLNLANILSGKRRMFLIIMIALLVVGFTGVFVARYRPVIDLTPKPPEPSKPYVPSVFLYAELSKSLTDKNIVFGAFDRSGTSSCCSDLPPADGKKQALILPFYGYNVTLYLVDKFTGRPLVEKSQEYIKQVYLCVSDGSATDEFSAGIFGSGVITRGNCNRSWLVDKCCERWYAPEKI